MLNISTLYAMDLDYQQWYSKLRNDMDFREQVELIREDHVLPIELEKALYSLQQEEMYDDST